MPAIYDLANRGLLPPGFSLVGFARRDWEDEDFAQVVHDAVKEHARTPFREEVWQQLAEGMRFVPGDFDDDDAFEQLARPSRSWTRPGAPAATTRSTCPCRRSSSRPWSSSSRARPGRRASAACLAAGGHREAVRPRPGQRAGAERDRATRSSRRTQVFRIDHYLGKETVQNILALRFANEMFEPIWNRSYVDHVQITMAEDIGIGGRAGYYDGIGAARDVIQNHLLQLLALTAMEEPVVLRRRRAAHREAEGAPRRPAARRPGRAHRARPVRGRLAGRRAGASATSRRTASRRLQDRHLRRHQAGHRQPPLGGRAVLPAHRQAAAAAGSPRSRVVFQRAPAPAVRRDRHRGARPERARHPGPAGRGHHGAVRLQGAGHLDGGPGRDDGLRLRRVVHRVQPRGVRAAASSTCCIGDPTLFPRHEEVELSWRILDPIEEYWATHGQPRAVPGGHAGDPRVGRRDDSARERTALAQGR